MARVLELSGIQASAHTLELIVRKTFVVLCNEVLCTGACRRWHNTQVVRFPRQMTAVSVTFDFSFGARAYCTT